MIYVVLGMHKSGTTLVSQTLHKSGISMGEQFDETISYEAGNQWERRESFLINLELFGCREEDYFSLDHFEAPRGRLPEGIRQRMLDLIDRCETRNLDWGFKDPLSCLAYPLWAEVLPRHCVIGVYRSPGAVLRHYHARAMDPVRTWRVLRAWTCYNRGVLGALRSRPGASMLLRYESLMNDEGEFRRLERFVGRPLSDQRRSVRQAPPASRPLVGLLDRCLGITTGATPSRVLAELDAVRRSQLSSESIATR